MMMFFDIVLMFRVRISMTDGFTKNGLFILYYSNVYNEF